ncbi:MAG: hypothetical protein H7125_11105 [Proteobacteria bacterium]|nr:hypothetical protein [Burkholderiales bacterium]
MLLTTPLSVEDYDRFRRFGFSEQPFSDLNPCLLGALLGLVMPAGMLIAFSAKRARSYPITG